MLTITPRVAVTVVLSGREVGPAVAVTAKMAVSAKAVVEAEKATGTISVVVVGAAEPTAISLAVSI